MSRPFRPSRAAAALLVTTLALSAFGAGCGVGDALVGGDCADGYALCAGGCCPVTTDAAAADGPSDVSEAGLNDGFGDRMGPTRDATSDGDGTPFDAAPSEAGPEAPSEASASDAPIDAPPGDSASDAGGPDGAALDAAGADGSSEASASDAPVDAPTDAFCTAPQVDCDGTCVDVTADPLNCGQCSNMCVSQLCVDSLCTGSTAGGIVYIGHDYLTTPPGTAQARVLSNAVLVPQNNPLHVLSYERYASSGATARARTILTGDAAQVGRGFVLTSTSVDTDIPATLGTVASYQVLLVHDQASAPGGALATLGASWASTLVSFTQQGGIVVVLDGGSGVGEMPQFSSATTLLSVTGQSGLAVGTPVDDVAPGDVVGVGVVSPYGAGRNSVSLITEPSSASVIYVIDLPSDAGAPSPVVVHKVF